VADLPAIPPDLPADLDDLDRPSPGAPSGTSIALFALIAVLMGADVVIDHQNGTPIAVGSFEAVVFLFALAGIGFNWRQMMAARRRSQQLDRELAEARAEARRWSQDAARWNQEAQDILHGLGAAIDRQFERWGLTPAEREVALLQLKGLRHKAIAGLRQTSERTVRQQALTVYRKSGLAGRNDLAAFFLEDLLLPGDQTTPGPGQGQHGSDAPVRAGAAVEKRKEQR
jgi:DNA-binding CsgD family transcriptional regulator